MVKTFYLFARKEGTEGNYDFVSYNQAKGILEQLDAGLIARTASDFAMTSDDARKAGLHLIERGYEVVRAHFIPGFSGGVLDLDNLLLDGETAPELLNGAGKRDRGTESA